MFDSVKRGLDWFIDGLVDAWTALQLRRRAQQRMSLVPVDDGYAIEPSADPRARQIVQIADEPAGARLTPPALAARLKNRAIDIVPPADEILARSLEPLPGESRQFLDSIVRHQLERLTPWRSEDVLHTYRVRPDDRAGDRIVVTVFATARSFNERLFEALQSLSPREVRLRVEDGSTGETIAIPIDNGAAAARRESSVRRSMIIAVSALAILIIAGTAMFGWAWREDERELESVSRAVAEQRRQALAARKQQPASTSDLKGMVTRRKEAPFIVLSLEALSSTLPDDTWLSELRVADGRVRLTGTSQNVARLVPLIEASPAFGEATFFAPTTRLPGGQGDRFHLEARLMPFDGSKPDGSKP